MPSKDMIPHVLAASHESQAPPVVAHILSHLPHCLRRRKTSDVQDLNDSLSANVHRGVTPLLEMPKQTQERIAKKEMKDIAKEELNRLWQYTDPQMKQQAKEYFEMMRDPNWR